MYNVSICVPTLGRADRLNELLSCIAGQLWALPLYKQGELEVCVSDNCSTDRTQEVLLEWQSRLPCLKISRQNKRVGFPENLAAALDLAKGEFVWLMGDDDLLMPGAIPRLLSYISDPNQAQAKFILINEAEFDRNTRQFHAQQDRNPTKRYTSFSTILEDCRLEGLGHISRLILRRDMMTSDLYMARRAWDLMPFLRWVVAAISKGEHYNLGETLIIAHYVADNPHWRGRWMYCYTCEIPELIIQIRSTCTLSKSADRRLLPVGRYLKGYFQMSLLRDAHHDGWLFARAHQPEEAVPKLVAKSIDIFWSALWMRRHGIQIIRMLKPSFAK